MLAKSRAFEASERSIAVSILSSGMSVDVQIQALLQGRKRVCGL